MTYVVRPCDLYPILRETVSSYTLTCLVESERREHLLDALVILCAQFHTPGSDVLTIRVDAGPGFVSLSKDPRLSQHGIKLDIGNVKNKNKNPVAEKAIRELGVECLKLQPEGVPLTNVMLAVATSNLNARIRANMMSAFEIWTQRDQVTGEQLPLDDRALITNQKNARLHNHPYSEKCKASPGATNDYVPKVGDLVYLRSEGDKTRSRDKYMVVDTHDKECHVRKFTKAQFRQKTYVVRPCDLYPICSTIEDSKGPIRGLEESSDSSSDDDKAKETATTLDDAPQIPPTLTVPPEPRRSARAPKPSSKFRGEEWIVQ